MIDALFGSKTRVKLLRLFLNNPKKSYYVREITRTIDEQINSVRRELSNLLNVGVISSKSVDNKLYYTVNEQFDYYSALSAVFNVKRAGALKKDTLRHLDERPRAIRKTTRGLNSLLEDIVSMDGIEVIVACGVLINIPEGDASLLVVGDVDSKKLSSAVSAIEQELAKDINYVLMEYDEFCYRLSLRDKFLFSIIGGDHTIVADKSNLLKNIERNK